ncbi:MAG TPA: hypothetical protein VF607_12620, partial [Verrucomicrobiae bacterium]
GVMSRFGRLRLLQLGMVYHEEIWENGQRIYNGPERKTTLRYRQIDDMLLGLLSFIDTFRFIRKVDAEEKINLIFTGLYCSGFAAWIAQKLGYTQKTISFLADFLPPRGPWHIRLHRRVSGWLTGLAARLADESWALSPRIHTARWNPNNHVVPIHVNYFPTTPHNRLSIGYIGYPSADHGLEILFEIAKKHDFPLQIIGQSPYLDRIRSQAPRNTTFHGMINDEAMIGDILANCFCSYAIYRDISPNSYSYFGFPSKTLYSFASNVPIVITNVAHFNEKFEHFGVGKVVAPENVAIEEAILDIKQNYSRYSAAIDQFRLNWNRHVEQFHHERFSSLFGWQLNHPKA